MNVNYLIPLLKHEWNPGKLLGRTASKSRSALKVDQPWKLLVLFDGLNRGR